MCDSFYLQSSQSIFPDFVISFFEIKTKTVNSVNPINLMFVKNALVDTCFFVFFCKSCLLSSSAVITQSIVNKDEKIKNKMKKLSKG